MWIIIVIVAVIIIAIVFEEKQNEEKERKQQQEYRGMQKKESEFGSKYAELSKKNGSGYEAEYKSTVDISKDTEEYERYVDVVFDNYYRVYTYIAPKNIVLKKGDKVLIKTHDGRKYVTIENAPYTKKKMSDKDYKVLDIIDD